MSNDKEQFEEIEQGPEIIFAKHIDLKFIYILICGTLEKGMVVNANTVTQLFPKAVIISQEEFDFLYEKDIEVVTIGPGHEIDKLLDAGE